MGTNYSLTLLVSYEALISGLKMLSIFSSNRPSGSYWYLGNLPILELISKLPEYKSRINSNSLAFEESLDYVTSHGFEKNGQRVSITISSWAQQRYKITSNGRFWQINLELGLLKNQDTFPLDAPLLSFLKTIVIALKPVYGSLEDNWQGIPIHGQNEFVQSDYPNLPWHKFSKTVILGNPLVNEVKLSFALDSSDNGLFFCEEIDTDLFFVTSPGRYDNKSIRGNFTIEQENSYSTSLRSLFTTLKSIPASILKNN
jgi:hypothetical protein